MISLPIFTENMKSFAWSFLNSSKTGRWKSFKKYRHAKRGKRQNTWRGCFSQTKLVPKNLFWWMLWYLFFEHLWKTPSSRRKLHPKSEKNVLQISHLIFRCCRVAKYPVYKFTFTFHVFYFFVRYWTLAVIILCLIEHMCERCRVWNGYVFRAMLKGVMLITLLSLMRHPLFEWRSRTKMAALNDNFKLIIEVILPGIFIFFSFFQRGQ